MRGLANGDPAVAGGLTPAGVAQARRLGAALRTERLDLCVTSGFERTTRTADEALRGRDVPRVELPALGDPGYGPYERRPLHEYRTWAWTASSAERPGGTGQSSGAAGESRLEIVGRYVDAFRSLLGRPEEAILVVCHALPVAYLLGARVGEPPPRRIGPVEYATPCRFDEAELAAAVELLDAWRRAPTW